MTQKFCSSCGEKVVGENTFCSDCGQPVTEMSNEVKSNVQQTPPQPMSQKANHNKWIYIGIAAIIIIIAYFSFTKSTPEKVAEEFVESLFSLDLENAKDLLAASADEDIVDEIEWLLKELRYDPEGAKEELEEIKKEGYTLDKFIVRDETKTKDFATLSVDMSLKNGEEDTGYIELVKESGKWKIYYLE